MKKFFLLILLLLTGCTITGVPFVEVEKLTLEDKDKSRLEGAIQEQDVSECFSIQTQLIREKCFVTLAQDLQDEAICNNLLGELKDKCKKEIS